MIATWTGTTISPTSTTNSQSRPGNSSQARAYAANALITTTRAVDGTVMRTVFHSDRRMLSLLSSAT